MNALDTPDRPRASAPSRLRIVRAFLIAPLAAPALYWAWAMVSALGDSSRRGAAASSSFSALAVVLAFGSPVPYLGAAIPTAGLYWMQREARSLPLAPLLVVGAGLGAITSVVLARWLRGELVSIPLPITEGAVLGVAVAAVFWRLAQPGTRE